MSIGTCEFFVNSTFVRILTQGVGGWVSPLLLRGKTLGIGGCHGCDGR